MKGDYWAAMIHPALDGKSTRFFQNVPSPARARFTTTQVVLDRVRPNGERRREGRDAEKASNGTDGRTDGRTWHT